MTAYFSSSKEKSKILGKSKLKIGIINNENNYDISKLMNMDLEYSNSEKHSEDYSDNSNTCNSCGSDSIIEDYTFGNFVCNNCGQVLDTIIDTSNEWKQCHEEDVPRCGIPINVLLPQSSLGTTISGSNYNRIKILHHWTSMPYKERTLNNEFKKIHDICVKANILKNVEDDAKILYKMVTDSKHETGKHSGHFIIIRGLNRIGVSASCLFIACVRNRESRTVSEIASLYGITESELNKGYKSLLKILREQNISVKIGTSKPEQFIQRYCDVLGIKTIYANEALKISKNLYKLNIASKHTPFSLAAASIYLMGEIYDLKSLTKKNISQVFHISELTIVKIQKIIEPFKYILIDDNLTELTVKKIDEQISVHYITQKILERMKKFGIKRDEITDKINLVRYYNETLSEISNIKEQIKIMKDIQRVQSDINKLLIRC